MEWLFVFVTWLVLSGAAAAYASNKGRSGVGIFFLSLFLSPLVGFVVAVAMGPDQQKLAAARGMKKCPECAQFVQADARTCPFCKKDLTTQTAFPAGEFSPGALSKKCPDCAEAIKFEALVCRFCGHKFDPAQVQAAIQHAKSEFEEKLESAKRAAAGTSLVCPKCGSAATAYETGKPDHWWQTAMSQERCRECGWTWRPSNW